MSYGEIAQIERVEKTIAALKENGIDAMVVKTGTDAKAKALELIPEGAEVMTMTSATLETIGLSQELNESGKYDSVRVKMGATEDPAQRRKLGAGPDYTVGSVHAVTEDGKVFVASGSGSQLPAYAYGAGHVIWIVGTQKITTNMDEALKRIYEYVLPLESARAMKAYGSPSAVNKMLIFNREMQPNRITLIFVEEAVGF